MTTMTMMQEEMNLGFNQVCSLKVYGLPYWCDHTILKSGTRSWGWSLGLLVSQSQTWSYISEYHWCLCVCVCVAPGSPSVVGYVTHCTPMLLELQLFHRPSYCELLFITDSVFVCTRHMAEFVLLDAKHQPRMARTTPITSTITSAITVKKDRNWDREMERRYYKLNPKMKSSEPLL